MKILLICLIFFSTFIYAQHTSDSESSILTLDPSFQLPYIPSGPLDLNDDIRIQPTTNTTQSEMSVAVHPTNDNIVLVSANTTDFPYTVK